ncbi:MAG: methyltransferase domain-containing protein [bacterium]|nr:methyltransferase domain-containing protein [bacterium]MDZ4232109.1 methyltransferase domain-containing protein [Candidatus Pacearchaeota archaeon]
MKEASALKLHLGCGVRNFPGFVNVDLAEYAHIHHKRSVDNLSIFKNDSADLIYASHVMEYFDRTEVRGVLKEWRRVLKKGGVLRLAVPDFEALARVYAKYKRLDMILGPIYGRWEIRGKKKIVYHKTGYDFAFLTRLLEENCFANVRRYDWRKVEPHKSHDDFSQAYIPHMDKENGMLISLNVEADKR